MNEPILVDAGPLVAIASPRDQHHFACVQQLQDLRPPLVTSWPVLAEAIWLLRTEPHSLQTFCQLAMSRWLAVPPLDVVEMFGWLDRFRHRYPKLGPQLADATLVHLAERDGMDLIFTVDRRDFSIYRIGKNRAFRLLPASL
jgi:predicted nucleic acid-binding protein